MGYTIKYNLTNTNFNFRGTAPSWIVIHNTANGTSAAGTAYNNTSYFKNINRNASANYFLDDDPDVIWCCVKPTDTAWHCGETPSRNGAYNYNAVGIEVCERADGTFSAVEIAKLKWLVQKLMADYDIPASRVCRHHDVTGKACPWYYSDDSRWAALKKELVETKPKRPTYATKDIVRANTYQALQDMPIRRGRSKNANVVGTLKKGEKVKFLYLHRNATGLWYGKIADARWVAVKDAWTGDEYFRKGAVAKSWKPLKKPVRKALDKVPVYDKPSTKRGGPVGYFKKGASIEFDYAKRNFYGNIWGRVNGGTFDGQWVMMKSGKNGWKVSQ